jgi:hypothetical protein
VASAVIEHLLQGFRVLVASDHGDFAILFSTLITVCGGLVLHASSALDARACAVPDDSKTAEAHRTSAREVTRALEMLLAL